MRIGGGNANRCPLRTVAGRAVRPTSGRVRQALFNMLRELVQEVIFLDLFAGTGSVGLEALSHGARGVYFIEHDRRALMILQANIRRCDMVGRATIVTAPLPQALQQLPISLQAGNCFSIPPTLLIWQREPLQPWPSVICWQPMVSLSGSIWRAVPTPNGV